MRIGECVMCALCECGPVCRRTFDYRRVLKLIEFACGGATLVCQKLTSVLVVSVRVRGRHMKSP